MSEWKTIGEIAEIYDGPHATPKKIENGYYFLSISSLSNGNLDLSKSAKICEEDYKKWTKRIVPIEGDLLFSYETRLGEAALMPANLQACLGRRMGLLRPNLNFVRSDFLLFAWLSPEFQKVIKQNTITGATVERIALSELSDFPILLPSLFEQEKIVKILTKLDQKIALNNQINEELEAMAKTLYDYWFVQFDFPDENGKPYKSSGGKMVYNDQLKREIPEGWEVKQLGELCEFRNGINYEKSETGDTLSKIVNVRNISNSSTFVTTYDLDSISLDRKRIESYLVTDRTILITRSGIPGATRIVSDIPANTIYSGFIIGATVANLNLFYYVFYHLKNIEMLMSNQSAGTIMKNISQTTLSEIRIAIPNKEIQKVFSNQVRSLLDVIENNLKQNQELPQLRDWLLPMLMNGQVKVEE
ncbi:TPA: restriction endonuclease subunit S [Streptococcus suis]|nr:restriction endonuclease subunit S [Streptococcus suis]MBS8066450.1 restriction endonuclease subunit S [Streptococcus suis]MBS8082182.1 restriction endonuclease subunit S [Streptococcus suis]MBS8083532.1 restriction endonuclease subunit S [Streptococcus suis]MBS8112256.1 restriction endonuclease subunit S [Streptococcus suis]MCH1673409.1 restriction endonuclease subunit S [Streptococcus suis]